MLLPHPAQRPAGRAERQQRPPSVDSAVQHMGQYGPGGMAKLRRSGQACSAATTVSEPDSSASAEPADAGAVPGQGNGAALQRVPVLRRGSGGVYDAGSDWAVGRIEPAPVCA